MYYRYSGLNDILKAKSPYSVFDGLNVFLLRHGESQGNALQAKLKAEGKELGEEQQLEDAKIKLTKKGIQQSKDLGKALAAELDLQSERDKTLVLVSPFERARESFEAANQFMKFDCLSNNVFVIEELKEQSYGAFSMIDSQVKQREFGKIYSECQKSSLPFYKPQFLGESPSDVLVRCENVIRFIEEQVRAREIKNVIIFGHRNVNRCLLIKILNLPSLIYDDLGNLNGNFLQIKNGKFVPER